ncbi:MAG: hypothetical protein JSV86_05995 [Gemmatimonadota bacterium]|nr:MAG: hypothetical protein JSV86_05995 [Gemmatimonadota bacterium]
MRFLKRRKKDFEITFSSPQGKRVLGDLQRFCAASSTSFDGNPFTMARNEGRREVWLHVETVLRMEPAELEALMKEYQRVRQQEESE